MSTNEDVDDPDAWQHKWQHTIKVWHAYMYTCFCILCVHRLNIQLVKKYISCSLSLSKKNIYIAHLYYKQFLTFIILAECRATHRAASFKLCHWTFRIFFSADGLFLKPLSTTQVTPTWIKQPYASHVWIRFSSHTCSFRFLGIAVNICSARISVLVLDGSWSYVDISPCLNTKKGPQNKCRSWRIWGGSENH